jgi:epoxyqueuosine reductase
MFLLPILHFLNKNRLPITESEGANDMTSSSTLVSQIKAQAQVLGFDTVGVARVHPSTLDVTPLSDLKRSEPNSLPLTTRLWNRLTHWLEQRYHGTMLWMERNPQRRADPTKVLPGCQSMIVVGMNYYTDHVPDETHQAGRIARYAWGNDYHDFMKNRLKELEEFIHKQIPGIQTRSYVDTGPIMEKAWAQEAGIGWIGKHTNVVSTSYGSWLLLGEILTTLELEPDEAASDLCGSCSLCIQACPTGAIVEPYQLDAERCISYLTIEHRGSISDIAPDLQKKMGNRIFGCDDCLDICPFNVNAQPTLESHFQPSSWTLHPSLSQLASLSQKEFLTMTKGSPLRRPKYEGFIRNTQIALQNQTPSPSSTATQQS